MSRCREPDGGLIVHTDWTLLQQFMVPVSQLLPPPPLTRPLGMAVAMTAMPTTTKVEARVNIMKISKVGKEVDRTGLNELSSLGWELWQAGFYTFPLRKRSS